MSLSLIKEINSNIEYWINRSDSSLIEQGKSWYLEANEFSSALALIHKIEVEKVAAILSILSPMKSWNQNKKLCEEFLLCQDCGHLTGQVMKASQVYNLKKINDQTIMKIIGGRKTSSFFHNIVYPETSDKVTIDVHMINALFPETWKHITPNRYTMVENCVKQMSSQYKLQPLQSQAIIWLTYKQLK